MDLPQFIAFMVMWMLLLFGILVIVLTYRRNRHLIDLTHKERMSALEHGLDVPAVSLTDGDSQQTRLTQTLYRGCIFTLVGLSLMATFGANAGARSALWGLPVTALGAAYLILYAVQTYKARQQ